MWAESTMEEMFSEMVDMFKKHQETSDQLQQQNLEIQAGQREILNILQNPQHQMSYQLTAEDAPVEDSSASGLKNVTANQLVYFIHENKKEISLIDNPRKLLHRLRVKDLIPANKFQVLMDIRDATEKSRAFYKYLEWFENEIIKKSRRFLEVIFKDDIIRRYPTLRQLKDKLLKGACLSESNGGITEDMQLSDISEVAETGIREIKDCDSVGEGTSKGGVAPTKEKRTLPSRSVKSFPSKSAGNYRKYKGDSSSAVIKKILMKQTLPVICKKTKGEFYRNDITKKGVPSIHSKSVLLFPGEFERLSGNDKNEKSRNWKKNIYIDMKKLMKDSDMSGHDLTKLGRITLNDLFMQTEQKLPNQKVRQPVIMEYRHLF
ncbi:uncharacterized protein LOC120536928 isoform X2 [Polypterus senegalus]|nr:uncharacterized protein LOC120536928 isoform X2 [Polypterus senegalus]